MRKKRTIAVSGLDDRCYEGPPKYDIISQSISLLGRVRTWCRIFQCLLLVSRLRLGPNLL